LREVFCLVLEFREEKQTFAKIEQGNVDFFLLLKPVKSGKNMAHGCMEAAACMHKKCPFYLNLSERS
jgi:hypothetical protein